MKLSSKATKKGSLGYSALADESVCDIETDECDEYESPEVSSFDELMDYLATQVQNDQVTQKLSYSRKGSKAYTARSVFTGKGVTEGAASVSFKIS